MTEKFKQILDNLTTTYNVYFVVKLRCLRRKTYEGKYDTRDKNLCTVLVNSSNHCRALRHV